MKRIPLKFALTPFGGNADGLVQTIGTRFFFHNTKYSGCEVGKIIMLSVGDEYTASNGDTFRRLQ